MKGRVKVAEVITRLDWAGSPDIVRLICTLSEPDKFDIRLVTGASAHLSVQTREFQKAYNKKTFNIPRLKRDITPFNDLLALIALYRLFRREKFDIVHTHTAKAGFLGRIAAKLAGVPYIVHTPHGHNFYGYFGPFLTRSVIAAERFTGRFTDKIMALTELEKRDLIKFKAGRPDNVVVIYSGLELERLRSKDSDSREVRGEFLIDPDEVLIGMVGRLEQIKGPEYFIEAAKEILDKFPEVKFLVVGDGSLRKKLEHRCQDLHISDKVVFTGWREDTPRILPILDLLVLPSLNEAVGRIILEAGACGVPVVAASVGGVPEIVKSDETGVLVKPRSSQELSKAIIALLRNAEKRKRMSKAVKGWVDDKFSAKRMVGKILGLYNELTRG